MKTPTQGKNNQLLYGGMILLECLLWGIGNPLIKLGLENAPPFFFIFLRYALAFVLFLLIFRKKAFASLTRQNIGKCLGICLLIATSFVLSNFALMLTTATTAGFFMGVSVLFTPFLERLVLRRRVSPRMWGIILVMVVGMYLLCVNGGSFVFGAGEAIALLCSVLFAAALVYSSKYISDIGPATLSTMQSLVACALALGCSLVVEGPQSLSVIDGFGWLVVVYLGVFSTCAAFLLQNVAIRHVSAVFTSLAFCTEPLFTAVASFFVLGERLSLLGIIGAGIILVGMFLSSFEQGRSQ